jgi:hypothetical protein
MSKQIKRASKFNKALKLIKILRYLATCALAGSILPFFNKNATWMILGPN